MTTRSELANRRRHVAITISWRAQSFELGFGFNDDGEIREAFCSGVNTGSDFEGLLDDACILLSHHL